MADQEMTIFEALRQDHDRQRLFIAALEDTRSGDDQRDKLLKELTLELESHASAEERHFYIPLMEIDETQEQSRHGIAEHHQIDKLTAALHEAHESGSGWDEALSGLKDKVLHHLEDEELEIFQQAGKALRDGQKTELAVDYLLEMTTQKNRA